MGVLEAASNDSFWRGVDYYKADKVAACKKVADGIYSSKVSGSNGKVYDVHLDVAHPKKSTCTCPFAKDRQVVCKHMVATHLTLFPKELDRVNREIEEYEQQEQRRILNENKEIEKYVKSLSKAELQRNLINRMIADRDAQYWR